jgi:small conductance mechanosensitive channel
MLEKIQEIYNPLLKKEIIAPICIIIVAFFLYKIMHRIIKKIFQVKSSKLDERKVQSVRNLLNNIVKFLVIVIAVLMILDVYGIQTSGLLTSLGVVGVVSGLAVQDILKDILSGASIILENQYAVGDIVTIGDFKGEIIQLGLRSTRIKAYTGEIKIIANRNITEVINYSLSKSLIVVDIPVSYREDLKHVQQLLDNLCLQLKKESKLIVGNISCIGVTLFDSSSVNFRITAEGRNGQKTRLQVQDLILKEVKALFDKENIEIPFDQVVIHDARV